MSASDFLESNHESFFGNKKPMYPDKVDWMQRRLFGIVRQINPENYLAYLQDQDGQVCARIATVSIFESKVEVFSTTLTCLEGSLATRLPVPFHAGPEGVQRPALLLQV